MSCCFAISHWPSQHLLYRSKTIKHQHSWSFHLFSSQPSPQEHWTEAIYTGQRHGVLCLPGHCFVAKFLGWSLKPGVTEERTIDAGRDVFCRTCDLGGFAHFGNQSVPTQMMNSKSWEQWISMLFRNLVSNFDMNGGIPSWNLKVPRFHWWTHWTHPLGWSRLQTSQLHNCLGAILRHLWKESLLLELRNHPVLSRVNKFGAVTMNNWKLDEWV